MKLVCLKSVDVFLQGISSSKIKGYPFNC